MKTRPISTLCSLAVLLASAGSLHAQLGRDLFARTVREVYAPGEAVTVQFAGLPGAQGDWIAIVKPTDPDEMHGAWQYAGGKTSGTMNFAALPEGEYEVRAYFDWPAGGYNVRSRYRFSVGAHVPEGTALARTRQGSYRAGDPIWVDFGGFPGAEGDWIAIVRPGDPDNTHGSWVYTGGKTSGSHEFPAMPPGEYEVRAYFDWPAGGYDVRSRYRFRVGG